jgi:hypothetical protein
MGAWHTVHRWLVIALDKLNTSASLADRAVVSVAYDREWKSSLLQMRNWLRFSAAPP